MKKDDLFLVIDMQNAYLPNQEWACRDMEGVTNRIASTLNKFPELNTVFTRFIASDKPKGVWAEYNNKYKKINNDEWCNDIVQDLKPFTEKFPIYNKSVYSSMSIPEVYTEATKAKRVVVSGVIDDCCVLSTVLSLIDAGCYVIYLTDGTTGMKSETADATITTLKGLSPMHVNFMTVSEYLKEEI